MLWDKTNGIIFRCPNTSLLRSFKSLLTILIELTHGIRLTCLNHRGLTDVIWYRFRRECLFLDLFVSHSVCACNTSNNPQATHLKNVNGLYLLGTLFSHFWAIDCYRQYEGSIQSGEILIENKNHHQMHTVNCTIQNVITLYAWVNT